MSPDNKQESTQQSQALNNQVISAATFTPSQETQGQRRLSVVQIVLILAGLLIASIFWFLFTARSVQLDFSTPASQVTIEGGLWFQLGGVYLLRQGEYNISAQAPLHEPLQQSFEVGDARNQQINFTFVPNPGFLALQLTPEDAIVTIADQPIQTQPIELSAGPHTLTFSHPRYQSRQVDVNIEGKQITQELAVELQPNWAEITVLSDPPGADILIDDVVQPQKTPGVVQALAGERDIKISLDGYKIAQQKIFSQAQNPQTLTSVKLIQADAQVKLASQPAGAGVTLNGQFVGKTPLLLDVASQQKHEIKLILNGYKSRTLNLNLPRGTVKNLDVALIRQFGEVVVIVEPSHAQLLVDGVNKGSANQTLKLPLTPHNIDIQLEGYAGFSQTIVPKTGITQEVKVRLLTLAEARLKALKPSITSPNGHNLVLLEPFEFTAGASRREPGRRANETLRKVDLKRLFYMATKEVSNAEFRAFASGHDSGEFVERTLNNDEQPVANLSFHDAAAYCNWLSEQADLSPFYDMEFGKVRAINPESLGYRLPTEAEWEWTARTQESNRDELLRFPWGERLPPPDRQGNYADRTASSLVGRIIFGYNDNYMVAAPTASFRANNRGIFDLGGNVAEWTNDFYEIPTPNTPANVLGPKDGEYRVIKGSSWMQGTITELRYSFRDYGIDGRQDVGFRVARFAE